MGRQVKGFDFDQWSDSLKNFENLRLAGAATDIDFFKHVSTPEGDRFLMMEYKPYGQKLPLGQKIAFSALAKQAAWEVVVVYGPDNEDKYLLTYCWEGLVTMEELESRIKTWTKVRKKKG